MAEDKNDSINKLMDICDKDGVAVTSVPDGHVLAFKRSHLQKLLNSLPANKETFVILVQRPKGN